MDSKGLSMASAVNRRCNKLIEQETSLVAPVFALTHIVSTMMGDFAATPIIINWLKVPFLDVFPVLKSFIAVIVCSAAYIQTLKKHEDINKLNQVLSLRQAIWPWPPLKEPKVHSA
jgi:hypothetical protein